MEFVGEKYVSPLESGEARSKYGLYSLHIEVRPSKELVMTLWLLKLWRKAKNKYFFL